MVFKRALAFMLVMVVFSATGCVNCVISINEHDDESADIQYQVSTSTVTTRLISNQGVNPIADLKQLAVLNGFKVKDLAADNTVGYTAEKHVNSVAQVPNLMSVFGLNDANQSAPIQINKSLIYHQLQLNTNIDLSGIYGQPGSEEEKLARRLIKNAHIRLLYATNKPLVNHNSDSVIKGAGDTKTYVWNITPGEQNQITLTTKSLQTGSVAALAVLALVVSYCLLMYVYLGKKENKQLAVTQTNEAERCMHSTGV